MDLGHILIWLNFKMLVWFRLELIFTTVLVASKFDAQYKNGKNEPKIIILLF
jgi:hypothetical protein